MLGKTLQNWGTDWELEGNIVRTRWEAGKYETAPIKGKKARNLECMLGPSPWLHENSLPKRLGHHFWPGLAPLAKNTLPIQSGSTFDFLNINCPVFQTFQM